MFLGAYKHTFNVNSTADRLNFREEGTSIHEDMCTSPVYAAICFPCRSGKSRRFPLCPERRESDSELHSLCTECNILYFMRKPDDYLWNIRTTQQALMREKGRREVASNDVNSTITTSSTWTAVSRVETTMTTTSLFGSVPSRRIASLRTGVLLWTGTFWHTVKSWEFNGRQTGIKHHVVLQSQQFLTLTICGHDNLADRPCFLPVDLGPWPSMEKKMLWSPECDNEGYVVHQTRKRLIRNLFNHSWLVTVLDNWGVQSPVVTEIVSPVGGRLMTRYC